MQARTRRHSSKPRMTAEQATSFDSFSVGNVVTIESQITCGCKAYQDVFTFNRWKALGCHVRKGEHGIRIPVISTREVEDKDTGEAKTVKVMHTSVCFCRCQVDANDAAEGA